MERDSKTQMTQNFNPYDEAAKLFYQMIWGEDPDETKELEENETADSN